MTDPTPADIPSLVELKPCPFCGGEAAVRYYQTESLWSHDQVTYTQIGCEECNYHFATEPGFEIEALDRWDTRPADRLAILAAPPSCNAGQPLSADEMEATGKAPWQGLQPIEELAKQFRGRPWVPLEAAISELQFWQRRDYEHALSPKEDAELIKPAYTPKARPTASDGEARERIVASALCRAVGMDPDGGARVGYSWINHRDEARKVLFDLAALPTTDGLVTYAERVEYEERILAVEMELVRARRVLGRFADKADKWETNHDHTGRDSTQTQHRLGDFREARSEVLRINRVLEGKIERPFAYCCAEGGGRVEGCDCVNKDHGTAWFDAPAATPPTTDPSERMREAKA